MIPSRTCEVCHCFDNCQKLAEFCKSMVFRTRKLDIELVDFMVASCKFFIQSAERTALKEAEQPLLIATLLEETGSTNVRL